MYDWTSCSDKKNLITLSCFIITCFTCMLMNSEYLKSQSLAGRNQLTH